LEEFSLITLLVLSLIIIKASVLYVLSRIFNLQKKQQLLFTLALAQGGEFAFVILTLTSSLQILTPEQNNLTTLVVAISMLMAPILLICYEKIVNRVSSQVPEFDKPEDIEAAKNVIIAGYGRFGQIIGRLLNAQGYHLSILDHSPSQISMLKKFGNKIFYGDAARKDLLDASGAQQAQLLVLAIDDADKIIEIAQLAQKYYPNLKLVARAIDRHHAYQLMRIGVTSIKRETFESALSLGVEALKLLGNSQKDAERAGQLFSAHDIESMNLLSELWGDEHNYGIAVKQRSELLKEVLVKDKADQTSIKACELTSTNRQ
jgi:glutathione-regulated potassium-efflux system ancillary protein KefC/glutathione-regulated potassium-efflux system protein KefB